MKKTLLFALAIISFNFLIAQDIYISEYVEGTSQNKAIELYNPTSNAIDLSNYKLLLYKNGNSAADRTTVLSGTIQPNSTFVIVNHVATDEGYGTTSAELVAKADLLVPGVYSESAIYWNGNDAIALVTSAGTAVDLFGQIGMGSVFDISGEDNGWTNITDTDVDYWDGSATSSYHITDYNAGPLHWLSWTKNHTMVRKMSVTAGITANPSGFNAGAEWDTLAVDNFDNLGIREYVIPTNTKQIQNETSLHVFPNPSNTGNIIIKSSEKINSIEIYNIMGSKVYAENVNSKNFVNINSSKLENGVYFIKVYQNNTFKIERIILN